MTNICSVNRFPHLSWGTPEIPSVTMGLVAALLVNALLAQPVRSDV